MAIHDGCPEVPAKRGGLKATQGGTSHIAPPDMNSYIEKYEFIDL